jgi:hypothetical protein
MEKSIYIVLLLLAGWSVVKKIQTETALKEKIVELQTVTVKVDSLSKLTDSLHNEMFGFETSGVRYEIALQYLRERDSVAAQYFDSVLSHMTE